MSRISWSTSGLLLLIPLLVAQPAAAALVREPYLQLGTPTSMTIVWRTTSSTDSRVRYGTSPGSLNQSVTDSTVDNDHVITITGLTPDTKYYYDVGSTSAVEGGGTVEHYFVTSPVVGAASEFTMWVVGDSGSGSTAQRNVRDAMYAETGSSPPQIFLHMGDMAYNDGTDSQFTNNFFSVYEDYLRHAVTWPTLGNHEEGNSESSSETGPYYEAYVLPRAGEAGGEPSGTEAYYSFDYANAHFIVLDSADTDLSPSSTMFDWLLDDLSGTTQDWIIAYFHHPPYTKGSHDSDDEGDSGGRMVEIREHALPILEAGGVDLVLAGHSHVYERSYLIDQVYCPACGPAPDYATPSYSTLLAGGYILDSGDGDPSGDGAYMKSGGLAPNDGTVYVVAGHGGRSRNLDSIHPVMAFAEEEYGSCLVTIDGDTLTLRNLRSDGVFTDTVSIVKDLGGGCSVNGDCDDGNPCTDDVCGAGSICSNTANTAPCEDGDACTVGDVCSGGSCVAGGPLSCDDGNVCTDDSCSPATGCQHAPNSSSCDDGDECTQADSCSGGVCSGGSPINCDDGNVCTADSCETGQGCVYTPASGPCDDGQSCSVNDTCVGGVCEGELPPECDDGNPCTQDTCIDGSGCFNSPQPMSFCDQAGRGRLVIRDRSNDAADRIEWVWKQGPAVPVGAFGNPATQTDYSLCLYDGEDDAVWLLAEDLAVGSGAAWTAKGNGGWKYRDGSGAASGVRLIRLATGAAASAKLNVRAKGIGVPIPVPAQPGRLFEQDPSVIVQLVSTDDQCWSTEFSAAETRRHDATVFKARLK